MLWVAQLTTANDDRRRVVLLPPGPPTLPPPDKPRSIGRLYEHEGTYRVDAYNAVAVPYPTVTLLSDKGPCIARVRSAKEVGVHALRGHDGRAEGKDAVHTHVMLSVDGCDEEPHSVGLGGAAVRWTSFEKAEKKPVTPSIEAALRAKDEQGTLTMVALSARRSSLVTATTPDRQGESYYLVYGRDIKLLDDLTLHGEVVADGRAYLLCEDAHVQYLREIVKPEAPTRPEPTAKPATSGPAKGVQ